MKIIGDKPKLKRIGIRMTEETFNQLQQAELNVAKICRHALVAELFRKENPYRGGAFVYDDKFERMVIQNEKQK